MSLPQFRAKAGEQVDAFEVIDPVLQVPRDLIGGDIGTRKGAGRSERARGLGTKAGKAAISGKAHEFEVLVQEKHGGDAAAATNGESFRQVVVFVAVGDAELNRIARRLRDVVEHRNLLNAVAAPSSRENEDVEPARERGKDMALCLGELDFGMKVHPPRLLRGGSRGDIGVVRKGAFKV